MTKKEAVQLCKQGVEIILNTGFAVLPVGRWHKYGKESRAGKVGISIRYEKRYGRRGYDVSVYGVFDEPDKAKLLNIDCNPYSGKYNFLNIENAVDMQYCINQYK